VNGFAAQLAAKSQVCLFDADFGASLEFDLPCRFAKQ
jgi:hypothetical protein